MCSRWRGSMPLNGSSSSSTAGSWTSAPASLARWRMPLEYVPMARSRGILQLDRGDGPRRRRLRIRHALQSGVEQHELPAREVRMDRLAFGHQPDLAIHAPVTPGRDTGHGHAARPTAASRPAMRCSSVVLPAPLGPSSPVTPADKREADVVDGDHVAVPARDVVDHDALGTGAGVGGRRRSGPGTDAASAGGWVDRRRSFIRAIRR